LKEQTWQACDGQTSLYKDALLDAWQRDGLYAYDNGTKFFRDIGTVNSWLESQSDDALQRQLRYQQKLTHSA
ncbi:MAG TPA: hypothetical protein VFG56_00955, partial [Candidatus Saccharimonadales bacterium]|nr:hypothetical protein [Candidatus Saccharimonadales bacterium]